MSTSVVCTDVVFPSETILDEPWIADVFGNDGAFLMEEKAMDIAPAPDASASDDAAFGIGTGDGYGSALGWLATLGALAVKVSALFLPLAHS
jgi:hypothetical protein